MKAIFIILSFFLFSEISLSNEQTLIGGKLAKPGEFEDVLYISSGRSRCSAAAVSKNVILTAAHCIEDGRDIFPAAQFMMNQTVFRATCTHHPLYKDKYSYDFALCKTDQEIDVMPATIARDPVELGEQIVLMGFGCTNPRRPDGSGGNGADGRLRWGYSPVIQLPKDSPAGGFQYFYTKSGSSLCFGDSGGPAMRYMEDPKSSFHEIVGCNSRGNIVDLSLLSSTFLPGFQNWALAWATANEVEICGINKLCGGSVPECPREKEKIEKWKDRLRQCQESGADTMDDIFEMGEEP